MKTKKAKRVIVHRFERTAYYYEYQCPHCKTIVKDYSFSENITRLKCSHCDNECIVELQIKNNYEKKS